MKSTEIGRICVMTTMPLVSLACDQVAGVDLPEAQPAVDGRDNPRVGQLQPRVVDLRLVGLKRAAILLHQRFLRRHLLPGDQPFADELRVAHQIALGVLQPRFVLLHLALRLRQRDLVRPRIDLGQQLPGADALAFGEQHAYRARRRAARGR